MSRQGQAWAWVATLWFTALVVTATTAVVQVRRGRVFCCWNLVPVVVFSRDLTAGDVVEPDALSQRSVPEQFVSTDSVRPGSAEALVGRPLVVHVRAGDLARAWMVREPSSLAPTEVAVRGAELVHPDDHVDVVGSFSEPRLGERVAMTLLQDVVVATAAHDGKIGLLLRPEEVERLRLAERLTVTVRDPSDRETVEGGAAMTWERLMRERMPRRSGCHGVVQIIRRRP